MNKGATWTKVNAEGRCRLCQRPSAVRPLTRHRVVPGCLGGPYAPANVVPLCRPCHDLIDNLADASERLSYRRMLRAAMWPQEIAYAYSRLRGRFDDLYPPPPREMIERARDAPAEYLLRFRAGRAPELVERPASRLVRLPRRSGVSGWFEADVVDPRPVGERRSRPQHLRHCKASTGGCVAGCPVEAVRLAV